jgi:hypothetical protein
MTLGEGEEEEEIEEEGEEGEEGQGGGQGGTRLWSARAKRKREREMNACFAVSCLSLLSSFGAT